MREKVRNIAAACPFGPQEGFVKHISLAKGLKVPRLAGRSTGQARSTKRCQSMLKSVRQNCIFGTDGVNNHYSLEMDFEGVAGGCSLTRPIVYHPVTVGGHQVGET